MLVQDDKVFREIKHDYSGPVCNAHSGMERIGQLLGMPGIIAVQMWACDRHGIYV